MVGGTSTTAYPGQLRLSPGRRSSDVILSVLDQLAAVFGHLSVSPAPRGPATTSDPVLRLHHDEVRLAREQVRAPKSSQSCSDNHDCRTVHGHARTLGRHGGERNARTVRSPAPVLAPLGRCRTALRARAAPANPPPRRAGALPLRRPPGQHRQSHSAQSRDDPNAKQGKSPELHGAICRIAKSDQHVHHVPLHGQCADHSEERRHDRSRQPEQPLHESQGMAPASLGLQSQPRSPLQDRSSSLPTRTAYFAFAPIRVSAHTHQMHQCLGHGGSCQPTS